jgi:hypothetical protein
VVVCPGRPDEPPPTAPFARRERVRRGKLASAVLLGFVIAELLLLLIGFVDPSYSGLIEGRPIAIGILVVIADIAAVVLNRRGWVDAAGLVMVLLAELPIIALILYVPGGRLDLINVPVFYLLVASELVAVSTLPPAAVFLIATLNSAAIVGVVFGMPHTDAFSGLLKESDDTLTLLAQPIGLQLIVASVAYLWVRSTMQAILRAERAERAAETERQREVERTRELDDGARTLLSVHIQLANGDFTARVPPIRNAVLWRIGGSLNTLVSRFQRVAQAEFVLEREQAEVSRLLEAIRVAQTGRAPIWPAASGVPLDQIVEALRAGIPRPSLAATANPSWSGLLTSDLAVQRDPLAASTTFSAPAHTDRPDLAVLPGSAHGDAVAGPPFPNPDPAPAYLPGWLRRDE